MAKTKTPLNKPNWLKNPWPWGAAYVCLILLSHCSEFDPNEKALSSFGQATTALESWIARRALQKNEPTTVYHSAQNTIDRLRMIQEPTPTPAESELSEQSGDNSINPAKKAVYSFIDIFGFKQNWRLFQSPHPEVQGFEVRAYHRTITPGGSLHQPAFLRCQDLDNSGLCEPGIGSRMEFEMLREIEKRRSPALMKAFSQHMAAKISKPIEKDIKKIEFVIYRHAFKLSKDFSKRGSAQILYSEDL